MIWTEVFLENVRHPLVKPVTFQKGVNFQPQGIVSAGEEPVIR